MDRSALGLLRGAGAPHPPFEPRPGCRVRGRIWARNPELFLKKLGFLAHGQRTDSPSCPPSSRRKFSARGAGLRTPPLQQNQGAAGVQGAAAPWRGCGGRVPAAENGIRGPPLARNPRWERLPAGLGAQSAVRCCCCCAVLCCAVLVLVLVLVLLIVVRRGRPGSQKAGNRGAGDLKGQKAPCRTRPRGPTAIGAAAQHYGEAWDMFRVPVWRPRRGRFPERYLKTPLFHPTPQPPSAPGGARFTGPLLAPPLFNMLCSQRTRTGY